MQPNIGTGTTSSSSSTSKSNSTFHGTESNVYRTNTSEDRILSKRDRAKFEKKSNKEHVKRLSRRWFNIFAQSKILITINPTNLESPEMVIENGDTNFMNIFRYNETDFEREIKLEFSDICGRATSEASIMKCQESIISSIPYCEYINLYRSDGIVLPCHVSIMPITNRPKYKRDNDTQIEILSGASTTKYAIFTIRSASVVGNAQTLGIGELGMQKEDNTESSKK